MICAFTQGRSQPGAGASQARQLTRSCLPGAQLCPRGNIAEYRARDTRHDPEGSSICRVTVYSSFPHCRTAILTIGFSRPAYTTHRVFATLIGFSRIAYTILRAFREQHILSSVLSRVSPLSAVHAFRCEAFTVPCSVSALCRVAMRQRAELPTASSTPIVFKDEHPQNSPLSSCG